MRHTLTLSVLATALATGACQEMARPQFSPVAGELNKGQEPTIAMPMVIPTPPTPSPGSLWVPGNKQFFKDSRAHAVGDIVTVLVEENAEAKGEAKSEGSRSHADSAGVSVLPFVSGQLATRGIDLATNGLLDTDSDRNFKGKGKNERKDKLSASIAAVVTQVLPNDLLVIQGQREVMVNYEKQVMQLSGIVRAEDITSANTVPSSKIAEARIAYVGDGVMDSAQTPQWGVKVLDKVMPF
ncbi:MAG: flagellar basal body L-ring protein FlgH [Pseudomonadaceae bacterium]|nr:flagellar basal body L-ring protein FlgH [Pseudomonadaceae bacterium]